MSYPRPLKERERVLEDAFFREESERLVAGMRAKKSRDEQFEGLSSVLGLRDPAIVDPLLDLGLREQNAAALVLAPLVCVAWADHRLEEKERRSIHRAEKAHGIDPNSDAGRLLEIWLEHRPHESLLDAWAGYVHDLCKALPSTERDRLQRDILSRAQRIAHAFEKSVFRGSGPVQAEKDVIAKIAAAFEVATGKPEQSEPDTLDEVIRSTT
ncbi:MAG: hypothetical protein CL908_10260 [Deltaproteobacteria bacterium]|jgi:hypothetical protein|nr:hypothetical protein [Deltaproteobacteria bacterium]